MLKSTIGGTAFISATGSGFNWSMQHLTSNQKEENVADEEIPKKASPYRGGEGYDVEPLPESSHSPTVIFSVIYLLLVSPR